MKIYSHTHIGKRKSQQDSFRIDPDTGLFLICDGVGGSDQGAYASRLVSEYIFDRKYTIQDSPSLQRLIIAANDHLTEFIVQKFPGDDAHTTIALVKFWAENEISIINIGDTRVYLFDTFDNRIWQTKDHTLLQEMLDHEIVSPDVILNHPMRHQLTSSIGTGESIRIEEILVTNHTLSISEMVIFICSDGVWELIDSLQFLDEIKTKNMADVVLNLKSKVNEYASDNATFILLDLRTNTNF
jgi:PPM family protein phosphatase